MTVRMIEGDCRVALALLADRSVHCVVTSPPYFGLRDYGTAVWEGGWDPKCEHARSVSGGPKQPRGNGAQNGHAAKADRLDRRECLRCGAVRTDSQIGLEASPAAYVAEMVAVFREIRRVLRDDGTLWLNLGDSYAGSWGARGRGPETNAPQPDWEDKHGTVAPNRLGYAKFGIKPKDLMMMPARVALALQEDGWYLRKDIIWHKPNPMPESCTDRPTSSHEHVFLLTKKPTYFYDADAVREAAVGLELGDIDGGAQRLPDGSAANAGRNYRQPNAPSAIKSPHGQGFTRRAKGNAKTFRGGGVYTQGQSFLNDASVERESHGNQPNETFSRNMRDVWTIATAPYAEAHFATFPPELAERCIKAGTSERGACPTCKTSWERVVDRPKAPDVLRNRGSGSKMDFHTRQIGSGQKLQDWYDENPPATTGWQPTCACAPAEPIPCTVLDPFGGAGTVGLVADRLRRDAVLVELNPAYAVMARNRMTDDSPLFANVI